MSKMRSSPAFVFTVMRCCDSNEIMDLRHLISIRTRVNSSMAFLCKPDRRFFLNWGLQFNLTLRDNKKKYINIFCSTGPAHFPGFYGKICQNVFAKKKIQFVFFFLLQTIVIKAMTMKHQRTNEMQNWK